MKFNRISLVFLLAAFLCLPALQLSAQLTQSAEELVADGKKRYGIESARIKYEYSDRGSGIEMVYFDQWGWHEMRQVDMQNALLGNPTAIQQEVLLDGTQQIMHIKSGNYASVSTERHLSTALQKASPAVSVLFGEEALKLKGAKKTGRDDVLGYSCAVYEIPNEALKVWVWKGIVLKQEKKVLDKRIVMEAVMVDEEWQPEASAFALPEGLVGMPEKK